MQAQVLAFQLELDLWRVLKTAKDEPETADIKQLWQDLEQVIEQSDKDQQLRVAGDAIASIVEVYAIRANAILSTLSVNDTNT
jgi:predicted nucleotidyltransferase